MEEDDIISQSLGVLCPRTADSETLPETLPEIVVEEEDEDVEQIKEDAEFARANLKKLIEIGGVAAAEVAELASQSQSSEGFDSLAAMIRTLTTANKAMLEMQKTKKDILIKHSSWSWKREDGEDGRGMGQHATTINNNQFIGTTQEILKQIEQQKDAIDS